MKISKITQSLLLMSLVVVVFNIARLDMWGTTNLLYLIWNLFLAWIPYIISSCFIKKETSVNYFIPIFVVWILFFPNAPYLVTDVLHIASSLSISLWYDSLLFFFFGWIGLLLSILSLSHVYNYLKVHLSYLTSEIIIFVICLISSFGIYLGRFERWNSWDIFVDPLHLIKDSLYISTNLIYVKTPLLFIGVFTIFMYFTYKTITVLVTKQMCKE